MNQEERRQKRQDEFKHAAVVVTVFVAKGHKGSKDTGHTEHGNFR